MKRYVIECPECGGYVEGKSGFFSSNRIKCTCGHVINVKSERMRSITCKHCGNTVVHDILKEDALCPICHKPLIEYEDKVKLVDIECEGCGIHLTANKEAPVAVCPVCGHENDVKRILAETKQSSESAAGAVIRYGGSADALVWKHPLSNYNSASTLLVNPGQNAVFIKNGGSLNVFGPGTYSLKSAEENVVDSEVWFVNMSTLMGIKWGTDSKVGLFDPSTGMHVEIGACGEFNIRAVDAEKVILKVIGSGKVFDRTDVMGGENTRGYFRSMIMAKVKSYIPTVIKTCGLNVLELDMHMDDIAKALMHRINEDGLSEYGLALTDFFITRIMLPEDDPNFRKAKEQYAEEYLSVKDEMIKEKTARAQFERKSVEAEGDSRLRILQAQTDAEILRMKAAAEAEAYRMKAYAEADEMKSKGYTYDMETDRKASLAAIDAGKGSGAGILNGIAGLNATMSAISEASELTDKILSHEKKDSKTWNCSCGRKGIDSNFCPDCGARRPNEAWDCPCGRKGITSMFCPDCGHKKD